MPLCLRFVALTAVRTSEARLARWSEFDLEAGLWTIPGERMKAGREHQVPLSAAALDVLKAARKLSKGERVFPGNKGGDMNATALLANWRRSKFGGTVHGLRSTFRDWCAETGVSRELAERCLAHAVGNATEAAYYRTTQLQERREVMDRWGGHLNG